MTAAAGGVDITDTGLEVGSTEINDLVLTFSDARLAVIDGRLDDPAKAPQTICRCWSSLPIVNFGRGLALPGPVSCEPRRPQGRFELGNLPAGEYFLTVVPDEQVVDWQDAPRLKRWPARRSGSCLPPATSNQSR